MKKLTLLITVLTSLIACTDADVASQNISKASEYFEVKRRVVFYNGITDNYIMTIEGFCSINPSGGNITVVCKTSEGQYKKHYLGYSDNVTYFVEQMESKNVSKNQYKVIFKPSVILPDLQIK